MKRFKMLISVLLMIFICMSCTARSTHKNFCYTIEKDSCVYAKIVNDSIAQIISEARTGTDDTSGINLHIVNNTADRKIIVKKTDDDSTNPRINVTQEGGTVNVI